LSYTSNLSIPIVSSQVDVEILNKMRSNPRLEDWGNSVFKLVNELHASNERSFFDHDRKANSLEVFAGDSFNIWNFRTGNIFAYADPDLVKEKLLSKLSNQMRTSSSVFHGLSFEKDLKGLLPFERARIAYRSVSNPTNSRTIIASLVPPRVILTHISPYVFTLPGHEREEAFLLGTLCSIPFDFYARKFIETAVDIHFMSAFPIPMGFDSLPGKKLIENVYNLVPKETAYEPWRNSLLVSIGEVQNSENSDEIIIENDALVAILFGLNEKELGYIFDNFQRGWDSENRKQQTLESFRHWKGMTQ
jgi:hypothetical protein